MKVALIQMKVVAGDVPTNRAKGLSMAREAAAQADIIVLPEIWTTGYALRDVDQWAEEQTGPTLTALQELALHTNTTIISGSIPFRHQEHIFNGAFVINPDGQIIADYQKIHLFNLMNEQRFFTAGNKRCIFPLSQTTAGLAICYDLRFPELFRSMTMDGARVIFLPSEWPEARGGHWRILAQARAIENQIYLCAVNCVGEHRNNVFYGHSMLVSPNGDILLEGTNEEAILYGTIDLAQITAMREQLSVWQDRRPELYRWE